MGRILLAITMAHPPTSSMYTMSSYSNIFLATALLPLDGAAAAACMHSPTNTLSPTFDCVYVEGPLPVAPLRPHHDGPLGGPRLPMPPHVKLCIRQGTANDG
jgi:hypothetical protein